MNLPVVPVWHYLALIRIHIIIIISIRRTPSTMKRVTYMAHQPGNAAIFDYATGGPCFGASDLIIGEPKAAVMGGFAGPDMEDTSINAGNLKNGKCSGFTTYELTGRRDFPVRGTFQLCQLEVYCNAQFKDSSASSAGTSWWSF
jgi:hypothetical protein